ncbi:MAG: outer membrane receptor protein involved in Fe transport [Cognaticolwellia sp.]|jgi:outer membrane receptor protein involved in Fe transport
MSNNKKFLLKISFVCTAVLTALSSITLYAGESDVKAETEQLEKIMVTSRRKTESVIEIPMNISTVSAMEIADRNLLYKESLFRTIAGGASPRGELVLRGLSGSNDSGGTTASVIGTTTTFTDGVPYDFSDLYDVERVEVLRGPQGTLYGSNAIGGTVRIITTKPQLDEFEVKTSVQVNSEKNVGSLDQRLYATVNLPIADEVALRITGSTSDQPLSVTNVNTGVQGNIRANFLRAQLLWQPQDDLSFNIGFIHDEYERIGTDTADFVGGGASYNALLTLNPNADFGYDVEIQDAVPCNVGRVECFSSGDIIGGTDPRYNAWELMDRRINDDTNMITLNIEHANLFDLASLSYAGSFRHYDDFVGLGTRFSRSDAGDMFRTWTDNDFQYKRTTHELRFGSIDEGSNVDWTVGYFFDKDEKGKGPNKQVQYHGDGDVGKAIASVLWRDSWGYLGGEWEGNNGEFAEINNVAELGMFYWGNPDINYSNEILSTYTQEQSFFGEISYTLDAGDLGELEFTSGIRFYELEDSEKSEIKGIWGSRADEDSRPDLPEGTPYVSRPDQGGEESGNRKKFSVSWRPDKSMSVYALYSEGYRPGGNNLATLPQTCRNDDNAPFYQTRYESDSIDNYEVGYKGWLFGNKMRVSTAVYHIDWTRVQAVIEMDCGFGFSANAATARSRGIEIETATHLTDDLMFTLNAGYVAAEMLENVESIEAKAGDDMAQVPKYNVYMALDQGFQAFNRQAFVRLDVEAYGEYKTHFKATDKYIVPAYEKVNLSGRIALTDSINASLHINNLFDKEIITWRNTSSIEYANSRNITMRLDFTF